MCGAEMLKSWASTRMGALQGAAAQRGACVDQCRVRGSLLVRAERRGRRCACGVREGRPCAAAVAPCCPSCHNPPCLLPNPPPCNPPLPNPPPPHSIRASSRWAGGTKWSRGHSCSARSTRSLRQGGAGRGGAGQQGGTRGGAGQQGVRPGCSRLLAGSTGAQLAPQRAPRRPALCAAHLWTTPPRFRFCTRSSLVAAAPAHACQTTRRQISQHQRTSAAGSRGVGPGMARGTHAALPGWQPARPLLASAAPGAPQPRGRSPCSIMRPCPAMRRRNWCSGRRLAGPPCRARTASIGCGRRRVDAALAWRGQHSETQLRSKR